MYLLKGRTKLTNTDTKISQIFLIRNAILLDGVFCYIYSMKSLFLALIIMIVSVANAQNDTLLYVGFDSVATDAQQKVVAVPTSELDLKQWENMTWLGAEIKTEVKDLSSNWFDNDLWKKWHKIPYIKSIDTIITIDTTTYDTTINVGLRSFSWFDSEDQALTVLLSPPVWIGNNPAKLTWSSMPIQGPRYQDGYKVYVLSGSNHKASTTDPSALTPQFIMKEMDNSSTSPAEGDSSLAKLYAENGFTPVSGTMHTNYSLPDSTNSGLVDSSRQHPFMEKFEIDLSAYSGNVQVLFFHDSHDDNGIIIDDITITGTGSLDVEKLSKNQVVGFPNPASNTITFSTDIKSNNYLTKVFSITGELVLTKKGGITNDGQITIDIHSLSPGIYQIEIASNSTKYYGRFSKK